MKLSKYIDVLFLKPALGNNYGTVHLVDVSVDWFFGEEVGFFTVSFRLLGLGSMVTFYPKGVTW